MADAGHRIGASRRLRIEVLEERRLLAGDTFGGQEEGASAGLLFAASNDPFAVALSTEDLSGGGGALGSISGYKWNDLDGDGAWDQPDEPALSGWIFFLDTSNNGLLDSGEAWTITNANGAYSFGDLPAGNYSVAEVMLPGWSQTQPGGPEPTSIVTNGGFELGNLNSWTAQSNSYSIINGSYDPTSPDGPFPPYEGNYNATTFFSSGTRDIYQTVTIPDGGPYTLNWAHRIRNHHSTFVSGTQEARVEIRNVSNQVLSTIYSTAPGHQLLQNWTEHSADLSAYAGQTIRIAFVSIANNNYFDFHFDDVHITVGDTIGRIPVTLSDGENVENVNFGNWIEPTGEIRGYKFHDLNGDGLWSKPQEPGLGNWTIYLDANNNGGLDSGESWTTTGADGSYVFTGLPAGEYFVSEVMQAGWTQTTPGPLTGAPVIVNGDFESGVLSGWTIIGSPTGLVINDGSIDPPGSDPALPPLEGNFSAISTTSGSQSGLYQQVTIPTTSHFTLHWAHRIRNFGTFADPSHEFRVEVRNTSDQVIATLFSTNPGDAALQSWSEHSASLSAFAGQTVRIAFVKNATVQFNVHLDNVEITNDHSVRSIPVSLGVGQNVTNANFGNWVEPLGEIHGQKWNDFNGNGQWEQGDEPALPGTIVYLDTNTNGVLDFGEISTITDASGSYSFTDLPPGEFVVGEVVPTGWTQTFPGPGEVVPDLPDRLFSLRISGSVPVIYEHNPTTGTVINSIGSPISATSGLYGMAVGPSSLFIIEGSSTANNHTLYEIDPDSGAVIDADVVDASLAGQIDGLAYLNGKIYVQKSQSNQLLVWDPASDTHVTTLNVNADIYGGLTGAGDLNSLFSVNPFGTTILRIDPESGNVTDSHFVGGNFNDTGMAYVNGQLIISTSNPGVMRVDAVTGAVLTSVTLGGTGSVFTLAGDGAPLYEATGVHIVTLEHNEIVTGINFGNWIEPPGEIHGYKWHDVDGDGVWDQPEEPALAGWLIYLDSNTNGSLDGGEQWTTTAADGSYAFADLPAGTYYVAELKAPGWTQTKPSDPHHETERLFVSRNPTGTTTLISELHPDSHGVINSFPAPVASASPLQGLAVGPKSLFFIDGSGTGTHTLYELDLDTGAIIDADIIDFALPGAIDSLAYLDGKVYAQKSGLDRIIVWDTAADAHVKTFTILADQLNGLTGAADLGLLFATRSNGSIAVIDPDTGLLLAQMGTSIGSAIGLAYFQGELLHVTSGSSGNVVRIDPLTGLQPFPPGAPPVGGTGTVSALGGDGVPGVPRGTHIVDVLPNGSADDVNFGNWIAPSSEICGTLWNDYDADRVWDQPLEPALAGWTIFLDTNANGILDEGEVSTTTDVDGNYEFTGLASGNYVVNEVAPAGWNRTYSRPYVPVGPGETEIANFGRRQTPGSITGQAWNDLDGDSVQDEEEFGLGGWTVYIDSNNNGLRDGFELSATTNGAGGYTFNTVHPGSHFVAIELQNGWEQLSVPSAVEMTPDLDVANVHFFVRALPGSISGQKWHDLDGDAVKDEGEPGLAGWTIFLDSNDNGTLDDGEAFTTTDVDGNYEFTGLDVGDYTVAGVLPSGWRQTLPAMPDLAQLLTSVAANHTAITSLVPNRHDFLDGEVGFSISDGGLDMYDTGNRLSTPFDSSVEYTNGVVTDGSFGTGSQYFTEKYHGLFVLAATDISVTYFQITGSTGHDGAGTVDSVVLSTSVSGQLFTIFVKRTYGTTNPTINHIVIVRGDGNGATHQTVADTDSDYHFMNNMAGNRELYYLLVSTTNGQFLLDADVLSVANAFLENITLGADRPHRVSVGPGEDVENVDFGNFAVQPLLGDYNRDSSVDAADYVVWRKLNGTTPVPIYESADGDGDSAIDADDRRVWSEHFGESASVGGGSGAADSSAVVAETSFTSSAVVAGNIDVDDSSRVSDNRLNRRVSQSDVYAEMFSSSRPLSTSRATIAAQRRASNASPSDALAVALQNWLARMNQLGADGEDLDSIGPHADDSQGEFFQSLDVAFESVAEGLSRSSVISRSKERLAALR